MDPQKAGGPESGGAGPAPGKPEIAYETFAALDLRTARVTAAEKHPGADKLTVLTVDLGAQGSRQIVAGIAQQYAPEDLLGKTIVIVANLKPVRLRGVESRGMLLAAAGGGQIVVLTTLGAAEPGWAVT